MANLYLVIGLPYSGRTNFVKKYMNKDCIAISFQYFIKKYNFLKAFNFFIKKINDNLKNNKTVFIYDINLFTTKKREEFLKNITAEYKKTYVIYIKTPIEYCIRKNNQLKQKQEQQGTLQKRSYLPEFMMMFLYRYFEPPKLYENFYGIYTYDTITKKFSYQGTL